jgi:hypothetical protein
VRKRFSVFIAIVFVFILLTAMGGSGGFERAPRVDKNYAVSIEDASGAKIEGEKFSWDGRLQFQGFIGLAQVNLPFDRVKEVTVGEMKDRTVSVSVRLTDNTETKFNLDAQSRCYGEASFGSFMLHMNEIKSIVFKSK